jgi:hypothetical protein
LTVMKLLQIDSSARAAAMLKSRKNITALVA